ncbi:hypothetical protein C1X30_23570 [Pseudomonas sp. FW305-BF6]|nr:hypothetical protein C1X28_22895 [Pseudomonas sp. FW305-BF15]PNB78451.1 hypothetical protein C1X30_23570 [Pseudomonas sp. FW305-BF6]
MGGLDNDELYGDEGANLLLGLTGQDILYGGAGNDVLDGGHGNDFLSGDAGSDTYRFSRGWGDDVINSYDPGTGKTDIIEFDASVLPTDIIFTRSGNNLVFRLQGGSDRITVSNFFSAGYKIDEVRFANGVVWTAQQIMGVVMVSTDGNDELHGYGSDDLLSGGLGDDVLYGEAGNDILDGGAGNDVLNGGAGSDIYRFSRGWGQDIINNYDSATGRVDVIEFFGNINPEELVLTRSDSHLVISLRNSSDKITVRYFFSSGYQLEEIRFASGTTWSLAQIKERVMASTDGNDELHGYGGDDLVSGGLGNDSLYGEGGNDVLLGGAGNDVMDGGEGSDTYRFERGWGQDTINNYDSTIGKTDAIEFGVDINPQDLMLSRTDSHLNIVLKGTSDKITVRYFFSKDYQLEQIRFADGTVWSLEQVKIMVAGATVGDDELHGYGTNDQLNGWLGNDRLFGEGGDDILEGGAGNDVLDGGTGSDMYRFSRGWGQDTINNYDTTAGKVDVIEFGADITPEDLVLTRTDSHLNIALKGSSDKITVRYFFSGGYQLEEIRFANGTTWSLAQVKVMVMTSTEGNDELHGYGTDDLVSGGLGNDSLYGEGGNDVLVGGVGNDVMDGGAGSDIYRFERGWGQDTINNYDTTAGKIDALEFGADIKPEDVVLTRTDSHLNIALKGSSDKITVRYFFSSGYQLEEIRFANGTTWSLAQVKVMVMTSTDGNDELHGYGTDDLVSGGLGNDSLYGEGGNDVLVGGVGNDVLDGGTGSDVYRFERGWGQDTINSYDSTIGKVDVIEFLGNITSQDIALTRTDNDLNIQLKGTSDKIVVRYFFNTGYQLEQIRFANGQSWGLNQINAIIAGATTGNDEMHGNGTDNELNGLEGDDRIFGEGGNDVLIGGVGNDTLDGGAGSDIYRFSRGWGQDTINNYDTTAGKVDVIEFGADINPEDMVLTRSASNLNIALKGTSDKITLRYFFNSGYQLEEIRFANGTTWSLAQVKVMVMTSTEGNDELHGYGTDDLVSGGLGNDSLYGEGGNDVLVGGVGNDVMDGGAGSDIYRFERGWGQDTINNYDTTAGKIDALEFGAEIKPEDLVLTRTDSHLNIALKGSSDKITVRYFFSSGYQLEEIRFANGTTWSLAQVKVMVMTSTDGNDELHGYGTDDLVSGGLGNDSLYGEGGNDVLVGGVGNDVLDGGTGSDVYRFERGWGQDTINNYDTTAGKVDALEFGADIKPEDLVLTRTDSNLNIALKGASDKITLRYFFSSGYQMEEIRFANGTTWSLAQVKVMVMTGTDGNDELHGYASDDLVSGGAGNDTLYGEGGNDILDGGSGNDLMDGGAGSDTYRFGLGGGQDRISNYDTVAGAVDTLAFDPGISSQQLWFRNNGSHLDVSVIGTSDKITVNNWAVGSSYRLDQFRTADGKTLLESNVQNLVQAMAAFGVPPGGESNLTSAQREQLDAVIAVNWQ